MCECVCVVIANHKHCLRCLWFVKASYSTLPLAVLYALHAYQNTASSCSASHNNYVVCGVCWWVWSTCWLCVILCDVVMVWILNTCILYFLTMWLRLLPCKLWCCFQWLIIYLVARSCSLVCVVLLFSETVHSALPPFCFAALQVFNIWICLMTKS